MYQLLAGNLAQRGYLVLTIDFAGFGESEDPFRREGEASFDFAGDVYAALHYMETLRNLDLSQISIIGHSMGFSQNLSRNSFFISSISFKGILVNLLSA